MNELENEFFGGASGNEDLAAQFGAASEDLAELGKIFNQRGNNWAGGARNFAVGLVPGALRAEAAIRSIPSGFADYQKYKDNAYDSQEGFAAENPDTATGLAIGGAVVPSLAAYLLTPFTGGGGAAAGTANLARAGAVGTNAVRTANAARQASLGARTLRSAGIGAGLGGTYGFMNERSEDLGDRFGSGATGLALGGGMGAVTPLALSAGGATVNAGRRILRGLGDNPIPEQQISDFMLKRAIAPDYDSGITASKLAGAAMRGDEGISRAALNLNRTMQEAGNLRNPGIRPGYNRIADAMEIPEMRAAKEAYRAFDAAQPQNTGGGLALNNLLKSEPKFAKLVQQELRDNAPDWLGINLSSREGLQKLTDVVRSRMPTSYATPQAAVRARPLERGLERMGDLMEELFPGQRAINTQYANASAAQQAAEKTAGARIRQMATLPVEMNPELSLTGAARQGYAPYVRGRARELMLNGKLYDRPSALTDTAGASTIQAIINGLSIGE